MSYSLDGLTEASFMLTGDKESALRTIATNLRSNDTCIRLDLQGNDIGDAGVEILCESLRLNGTLQVRHVTGIVA